MSKALLVVFVVVVLLGVSFYLGSQMKREFADSSVATIPLIGIHGINCKASPSTCNSSIEACNRTVSLDTIEGIRSCTEKLAQTSTMKVTCVEYVDSVQSMINLVEKTNEVALFFDGLGRQTDLGYTGKNVFGFDLTGVYTARNSVLGKLGACMSELSAYRAP